MVKRVSKRHTCPCIEVEWGSDKRFTRCVLCGECRYYPNGYTGQVNYTQVGWTKVRKDTLK